MSWTDERIERLTKEHPADAWIVQSANREVFEWFSRQSLRAFGLFGRFRNVPIAGTGVTKGSAVEDAVRQLYTLGHRRIAFIAGRLDRCHQVTAIALAVG